MSSSDSTLRGHFPAETDVLNEELGPFDVTFMIPAHFEAGRVTIHGVLCIEDENGLTRTDQTPFAKDSVFGYTPSYLPDYIVEKTGGRVAPTVLWMRGSRRTWIASLWRCASLPARGVVSSSGPRRRAGGRVSGQRGRPRGAAAGVRDPGGAVGAFPVYTASSRRNSSTGTHLIPDRSSLRAPL